MSEFPYQVTVKPPAQYASAPWLNFQAQDKDELEAQIKDSFPTVEADSLSELVAKAFLEYGAVLTAAIGLAAPAAPAAASIQSPGPAPQWAGPVAPAAPSGPPAPQCPHGEKIKKGGTYQSGPNKGKPWEAWMCRGDQNDPSRCKPVDVATGRAWK